jgi:hypothetical protein
MSLRFKRAACLRSNEVGCLSLWPTLPLRAAAPAAYQQGRLVFVNRLRVQRVLALPGPQTASHPEKCVGR